MPDACALLDAVEDDAEATALVEDVAEVSAVVLSFPWPQAVAVRSIPAVRAI